jgi:hypothetical protein
MWALLPPCGVREFIFASIFPLDQNCIACHQTWAVAEYQIGKCQSAGSKIAIDWSALHHFATAEGNHITLDLTRDQVKAAPEYKEGGLLAVIGTTENPPAYPGSQ